MTDKEKIKAEIESQLKIKDRGYSTEDAEYGYRDALEDILRFIDSIPEEPVSEDLEEAWNDAYENEKDEILVVYDHHAGFVAGVNWKEEQMIAEACEWLKDNLINYWSQTITNPEIFVNDFKKAMEESK